MTTPNNDSTQTITEWITALRKTGATPPPRQSLEHALNANIAYHCDADEWQTTATQRNSNSPASTKGRGPTLATAYADLLARWLANDGWPTDDDTDDTDEHPNQPNPQNIADTFIHDDPSLTSRPATKRSDTT